MTKQDNKENKEKHNHILPLSLYLLVGSTLLVLTVVTVVVASFDLGSMNLVVAMIIAAVKGTLVVLYFMHLRYDNKMYSVIFGAALFFLATFIIITMFDTMRRDDIYNFRGGPVSEPAVIYNTESDPKPSDSLLAVDSLTAGAEESVSDSIGH